MGDEVVFAKTRHTYDSYTDFWKLVELSEFPIVYIDEMDLYDPHKIYISAPHNGEWNPHLDNHPDRKAKFFLWNLERPGASSLSQYKMDNQRLVRNGYFTGIIVSDRKLAADTGFHYVPLGSHSGLGSLGKDDEKIYDVVHLMCYSLRRAEWFNYLTPHSDYAGVSVAPNGWGEERHRSLLLARFMFNIHQDEYLYMEPLRFTLAAAYGLPIITEICYDIYPYQDDVVEFPKPSRAVEYVRRSLSQYGRYKTAARIARARMTSDYSFRRCIERYL